MNIIQQIQNQLHNLPTEKQIEVLDFVNFLQQRAQIAQPVMDMDERKKQLFTAFEQLAQMKTFADIKDPVAWQKQIREDRPLPGREA